MKIFASVCKGFSTAVNFIVEVNRKAALINRIKTVIETEEQNSDRAYIALGKYYYKNLRDNATDETRPYCIIADNAERRLSRAKQRLEELREECCECECCEKEEPSEESWEPMSELSPEEDVLDGDAVSELKHGAESKEAADDADGAAIPWA